MERIPQIRLFSSDKFRRCSLQPFIKINVKLDPFASSAFYSTVGTAQPTFQKSIYWNYFMDRTNFIGKQNSVSSTVQRKASQSNLYQNNYYQNAIRLSEKNKLLEQMNGHKATNFKSSYLAYNHLEPKLARPCTLCQAQTIIKTQHSAKLQHSDANKYQKYRQNSYLTQNSQYTQTSSQAINPQLKDDIISAESKKTLQKENRSSKNLSLGFQFEKSQMKLQNQNQKRVSFQQIINSQDSYTFRQQKFNQNQISQKYLKNKQLQDSNKINQKFANLENIFLSQINLTINQLTKNYEFCMNPAQMLEQLQEMVEDHLKKKKDLHLET